MSEQDRFGKWFGGKAPPTPSASDVAAKMPQTSGAEQDRYGNWFGGKAPSTPSASDISAKLPQASGAEQDRYGNWFGGKAPATPSLSDVSAKLPQTSGAEQDRYGNWFSGKAPSASDISARMPQVSGAEQDRYAEHFSGKLPSMEDISARLPQTSGAEQDRYAAHFSDKLPSSAGGLTDRLPRASGAEQDRYDAHFGGDRWPSPSGISERLPRGSGAEQDRYGGQFGARPAAAFNATSVGLLQSAVLPSLGFHVGLSAVACGVARYTDRLEVRDMLWPAGITANAWWSAVGTRVLYDGLSAPEAWSTLGYSQKLLLAGVSAWGIRLLAGQARRSVRRGGDDPRYTASKSQPDFWNKSVFTIFLPEAISQTLVSLPLVLPFRASFESANASLSLGNPGVLHSLAVFLFSTGFALEHLADRRADSQQQQQQRSLLNREGIWSVVRQTGFIGDALMHASFPILLLGAGLLHPLALAGPIANAVFLRFVASSDASETTRFGGAEAQSGSSGAHERQDLWASAVEGLQSRWTWIAAAVGIGGVFLERTVRAALIA